jgi:uncharacterized RDD family membrane protein YckC
MEDNNYEVGHPLATPLERLLAALIDGVLILLVSATGIGSVIGLAYHLTKDALPFLNGQSLGKKLFKLRVVYADTNQPITNNYEKAMVRSITLLIPIFNVIDAFMVFTKDRTRFGDQWARTIVVKDI